MMMPAVAWCVTLLLAPVAGFAPRSACPKASPVAAVAVEQTTSVSLPVNLDDAGTASCDDPVAICARCLAEAGYKTKPFSDTLVGVNSAGTELVAARGGAWRELFEIYEDAYVPTDAVYLRKAFVIAHFLPTLDGPGIKESVSQLSHAREDLESLLTYTPVVACIFSGAHTSEGDLADLLQAADAKDVIDSSGIFVFNDVELVRLYAQEEALTKSRDLEKRARAAAETALVEKDTDLTASQRDVEAKDAALATAKDVIAASEAKATTLETDLTAAQRDVAAKDAALAAKDAALAELASATDDPALRAKLEGILSAGTTRGAE